MTNVSRGECDTRRGHRGQRLSQPSPIEAVISHEASFVLDYTQSALHHQVSDAVRPRTWTKVFSIENVTRDLARMGRVTW
jgi:hypothetical protein